MRKKKTAMYLLVITSLLAMSVVLPLLINAFSGYVAGKIRQMPDGVEKMTESADGGDGTDHTVNIAADETERADPPSVMSDEKPASGTRTTDDKDTIVDVPYYDEPIYDSAQENNARLTGLTRIGQTALSFIGRQPHTGRDFIHHTRNSIPGL